VTTIGTTATNDDCDPLPFGRHHAFIIGIDAYDKVPPLQTAVADARQLAAVLGQQQHFLVHPALLDATADDIRTLLQRTLPEQVGKDDRVFFYFAGHGTAADGDDGPAGFILPADADPTDETTLIPMADLQAALNALPCRHLLLVLDCCFSGAFKWSSQHRDIGRIMPKKIYKERFDRFIVDPAWQVITSAAYDQKALDVLHGNEIGARGITTSADQAQHSPFAKALFEGLSGKADARLDPTGEGDGVITATELYSYIRDQVEPATIDEGQRLRQTPRFFPLQKHDKGEFIFLKPNHRLNLPPIPKRSPYKGLAPFDEEDQELFYGRDRAIRELLTRAEHCKLLVVTGASGTGKSSVVKAGLLPVLRAEGFQILKVMRPGARPLAELDKVLAEADTAPAAPRVILVIDQFEELITRCPDPGERQAFDARLGRLLDDDRIHRLILTVRADFEPQLNTGALQAAWMAGRCTAEPFSLDELEDVIVMPTMQEVLIFDPPDLVEEIMAEVVRAPGAVPLLSCTLSELYEAYRTGGRQDRALRKEDYDRLGGLAGVLLGKADTLHESLTAPEQDAMRKIMLRMVSVEEDLEGKRVPVDELAYSDLPKALVDKVVERLVDARLIVKGQDYIEPAHDALVRKWETLNQWIRDAGRDKIILGARLNAAANEFAASNNSEFLWNRNPNLPVVEHELRNNPRQWFNAKERAFVEKSVARRKRLTRITGIAVAMIVVVLSGLTLWALDSRNEARHQTRLAQEEKDRALRALFSGLNLSMSSGYPGAVCAYGLCGEAPRGDGDSAWVSLGRLPVDNAPLDGTPPISRDFAVARQFGEGHVLVYAQDGLTRDDELVEESDNLLFTENALAWLAPLESDHQCGEGTTTILLKEGTFTWAGDMTWVQGFIEARGWALKVATNPESLATDLRCAQVLWYLSDWEPSADFATEQVPLIEKFVEDGGGLLVGGLGWSYAEQGGPNRSAAILPYAANQLGKPFGFEFTDQAFWVDTRNPIRLLPGESKQANDAERER
jgi:hypothetical protein